MRRPTATRTASSSSLRPHAEMGHACSQCPPCGLRMVNKQACDKGRCNEPQEPRSHAPPKPDPSISAWIFRGLVEQVVYFCQTKLPTHCQLMSQKDSPPAKAEPGDPVLLLPRQEMRMV